MRWKSLMPAVGLQLYVFFLVWLRLPAGVVTDEAKYLLNIPYPHPPLLRWVLHLTDGFAWTEIFWRILLATLVVQAVWIIHQSLSHIPHRIRCIACASWLLSGAVVLYAASIMMAPMTAVFGLLLVCLIFTESRRSWPLFLACLWFAQLMVAYQAVLYLPLLIVVLRQWRVPVRRQLIYIGGPLAVLVVYSLSNPLALASMLSVAGGQALGLADRLSAFVHIFIIGGSMLVSIAGILGAFSSRRAGLVVTMVLVCAYILLSPKSYYVMLLLPVLVGGIIALLPRLQPVHGTIALSFWIVALLTSDVLLFRSTPLHSPLNATAHQIASILKPIVAPPPGTVLLINGDFGHEWQFYLPYRIVKYSPQLLDTGADIVVCLETCNEELLTGKQRLDGSPAETWVTRY